MSDAVTRLNAALEGHYAIERELGPRPNGAKGARKHPLSSELLEGFERTRGRYRLVSNLPAG